MIVPITTEPAAHQSAQGGNGNSEPVFDAPTTETQAAVVNYVPKRSSLDSPTPLLVEDVEPFAPPMPTRLEDLDVNRGFLTELALKAVALEPDPTTAAVAARMHLGIVVVESLLQRLHREKMIEIKGLVGLHNHRYGVLDRGWTEVNRLMALCSYAAAAPVSLRAYTEMLIKQVHARPPVTRQALDKAMAGLVLSDAAKQTLGLVASSGRSLFLSGPSGNGKSAMARAIVNAIDGDIWIPFAIEVDGQVIRLFDPHNHQPVTVKCTEYDTRWIKIRPPLVVVGGELTLASMELSCTDTQRFYEAPFQLKSNGGVLVVDDFGRQRCSATELMNRWIIPLEQRVDYLTLSTGKKIEVLFEQIIVFATNLTVADLADEAFLRRMGYRLYVMPPGPDTYAEIFRRYAHSRGLSVDPDALAHLEIRYGKENRIPKACEPRDLVDRAVEACKYQRTAVRLTKEALDVAWDTYFGASATG